MRTLSHTGWCALVAATWISSAIAGIDQPWNEPQDLAPGDGAHLGWALLTLAATFALFAWAPRVFLGGLALFFIGVTVNQWFGGVAAVVACIAMCVWWLLPSREAKRPPSCRDDPPPQPDEASELRAKPVCNHPQREVPPAHHDAPARCSPPAEQIPDTRRIANLRARIDSQTKRSWVKSSSTCACGQSLKIESGFKGVVRCDSCGRLSRIGLDG